jgi:hypothetical protein
MKLALDILGPIGATASVLGLCQTRRRRLDSEQGPCEKVDRAARKKIRRVEKMTTHHVEEVLEYIRNDAEREECERIDRAWHSMELHREQQSSGDMTVPMWVLGLLRLEDARRYALEWGAHLHQLVEEGQAKRAHADRRWLALSAVTLALTLRLHRVRDRVRRRTR